MQFPKNRQLTMSDIAQKEKQQISILSVIMQAKANIFIFTKQKKSKED